MSIGYMYILKCCDDTFYTGSTINLRKRFLEHQAGVGANYTAKRIPVSLFYFEEYQRIDLAFKREKQVQNWSRKKKQALVMKEYKKLQQLSFCKNTSHYSNKILEEIPKKDSLSTIGTERSPSGVEGRSKELENCTEGPEYS